MDLITKPDETNIFTKYSLSFCFWRIVTIILKTQFLLEIQNYIQDKKQDTNMRGGREEKSTSEEGMADVAEERYIGERGGGWVAQKEYFYIKRQRKKYYILPYNLQLFHPN